MASIEKKRNRNGPFTTGTVEIGFSGLNVNGDGTQLIAKEVVLSIGDCYVRLAPADVDKACATMYQHEGRAFELSPEMLGVWKHIYNMTLGELRRELIGYKLAEIEKSRALANNLASKLGEPLFKEGKQDG